MNEPKPGLLHTLIWLLLVLCKQETYITQHKASVSMTGLPCNYTR